MGTGSSSEARANINHFEGLQVLVVEDAHELQVSYPRWLRATGACCAVQGTLNGARRALKRAHWDALVVDKFLPDGDAHQALLTSPDLELPQVVVAVSGHYTPESELAVQAAGAVLLRKPFGFQDLLQALDLAMTRARRSVPPEPSTAPRARSGPWQITADGKRLVRAEFRVELTPRERELIVALWQDPGTWFATTSLNAEVLGRDDDAGRDTIRSHVRRLRKKLGAHRTLLESDRRQGYRWRVEED